MHLCRYVRMFLSFFLFFFLLFRSFVLSFFLSLYLPTYLPTYVSIYVCTHPCIYVSMHTGMCETIFRYRYGNALKWWYPQIIHVNVSFHYKPSNLNEGTPLYGNPHI